MVGRTLISMMYLLSWWMSNITLVLTMILMSSYELFNINSYVPNTNISCYKLNDNNIYIFPLMEYKDFEYDCTDYCIFYTIP